MGTDKHEIFSEKTENDVREIHKSFCRKVKAMLDKQAEYFRSRDKKILGECKKLEREVRSYCEIITGTTLFN